MHWKYNSYWGSIALSLTQEGLCKWVPETFCIFLGCAKIILCISCPRSETRNVLKNLFFPFWEMILGEHTLSTRSAPCLGSCRPLQWRKLCAVCANSLLLSSSVSTLLLHTNPDSRYQSFLFVFLILTSVTPCCL